MALKKDYIDEARGIAVENAYTRIHKVEILNGEKVIIDFQTFSSEELCDHGKGESLSGYERVEVPHYIQNEKDESITNSEYYKFLTAVGYAYDYLKKTKLENAENC